MKDRRAGAGAAAGFPSSSSIGCISHSAISVADALDYKKLPQPQPHKTVLPSAAAAAATTPKEATAAAAAGGAEERGVDEEKAVALRIVAAGVQRLIKGIKSFTHMFAAGYDGGGEEEEDEEEEIVIGYPTDVVHVGHIGWDGGRLSKAGAFSQLPSSSLQLEIAAMEASSHASTPSI